MKLLLNKVLLTTLLLSQAILHAEPAKNLSWQEWQEKHSQYCLDKITTKFNETKAWVKENPKATAIMLSLTYIVLLETIILIASKCDPLEVNKLKKEYKKIKETISNIHENIDGHAQTQNNFGHRIESMDKKIGNLIKEQK